MSAFQPSDNRAQGLQQDLHQSVSPVAGGGRFDFDDGGVYVGGWQDGKAHGHGICTGPKSQGEYSGSWHFGFEVSGVYKWPSGANYEGQWQNGKRHGIGVEYRGKWVYKGEWTQGYKGRYGVRGSLLSTAKYEGTWANGLQDGYGSETYADGGTYQGQWQRGMRHGYGVRQSAPYGHCNVTNTALIKNATNVSIHSLDTEGEGSVMDQKRDTAMRGGFVLVIKNSTHRRRNSLVEKSTSFKSNLLKGFRLKKQKSTGDIDIKSNRLSASVSSSTESGLSGGISKSDANDQADAGSTASFLSQDGDISDPSTTETYMGEWKNDKRCGFGISERSDGLRYEGEWYNNRKYGYGVTTFKDGTREEGKYKNNQLVTSAKKKHLFVLRSSKLRERIESAVQAGRRAQQIALQKADIAISRTATARGKSEQGDAAAIVARNDSHLAFIAAKQYGGFDVNQLHPPEVPLRRRLSDFSQIKRRDTRDHMIAQNSLHPSHSRMYLDPNEPFGGRRGSFRNQNQDSLSLSQHSSNSPHLQAEIPFHQKPHCGSPSSSSEFTIKQSAHLQTNSEQNYSHSMYSLSPSQSSPQDSFSDHFDHYQKLVSRYAKSRQPSPYDHDYNFNTSKVNLASNRIDSAELRPMNYNETIVITKNKLFDSPPAPTFDSELNIQPIKRQQHMNQSPQRSEVAQNQKYTETDVTLVKQWRTGSLYHPPGYGKENESSTSGISSSSSLGLKRKPSLQSNISKQIQKPIMSREEISALSHAQREQRRYEAELAERMARNPLLYFVNPRFRDWLNRRMIIIGVFLINITLAIAFFKLLG